MPVTATTHLNFRGNARKALEFYHSVFGGHVMVATYGQVGVPQDAPTAARLPLLPSPRTHPTPTTSRSAGHRSERRQGGRVRRVRGHRRRSRRTSAATGHRAHGLTHTESVFLLLNGDTID
jgi:PhnB protein